MKKRSEKTNNKTIKKLKIACVASLSTIALSVGGIYTYSCLQPSHYEGEVFDNENKQTTTTTSSSTIPSSSDETGMVASDTSSNLPSEQYQGEQVTESKQQVATTPAYQPTYKIVNVSAKYDLWCVEHIPTGDKTKPITYENAEAFCTYMHQMAYGKEELTYTMQENYETWVDNQ